MRRWALVIIALTLLCMGAAAQPVISLHSGLVDYFDGEVSIDGQEIHSSMGRFPEIPEDSILRTREGRAEVLLAPGVFVWIGSWGAIRVQGNSLLDARIEFLEGSAIVQSAELLPDNAVTLICRGSQVRLAPNSRYRFEAPTSLTLLRGQAKITNQDGTFLLQEASRLDFSSGLITARAEHSPDRLDRWAEERWRTIEAADLNRAGRNINISGTTNRSQRIIRPYPTVVSPIPRRAW